MREIKLENCTWLLPEPTPGMIITAGPGTIDKERHGDITAVAVNDESGNISHYEWRWSDGTPLLRFEAKTPEQA